MIPADWKKKDKGKRKSEAKLRDSKCQYEYRKKKKLSAEYSEVIKKKELRLRAFRKCRDHYRLQI